ncbi:MAG: HTH-type transcriptional repressor GamR [Candidatus Celerinatantimonas neptuna]|nr:MAG: HTH-type transcriptional repressor GamR [Candidatus Celerinatantimonas neptuna]
MHGFYQATSRAYQGLLQLLVQPDYRPGTKLPAERYLANQLHVSRMTLRKAIDQLQREGVLERRPNQGTFVRPAMVARPVASSIGYGMSWITQINGALPQSRLLSFRYTRASQQMSELLKIRKNQSLVAIKRLRQADDTPVCLEISYLPAERVPGLQEDDIRGGCSLYRLLQNRYHIYFGGDSGQIRLEILSEEDARFLILPEDHQALVYRGLICDTHHNPIEYLVSINHPKLVAFRFSHQPTD